MVREYDLAQLDIDRLVAPTDSPIVAEFMDALDAVTELAERTPAAAATRSSTGLRDVGRRTTIGTGSSRLNE